MNHAPVIRPASINLWTLGHRRYYSPMLQVAGRFAAADVIEPIRPRLDAAPCGAPAGASAVTDAMGGEGSTPISR
jgi:hypothetical protein